MPNQYCIQDISSLGDVLTVKGTVDGTPVIVTASVAAAGGALASAIAFENFIAPLLLAQVPSAPVVYPSVQGLTFTK